MKTSGGVLREQSGNLLNTSFPQRDRTEVADEPSLIIDKSAFKLLSLSTIANLSRLAEQHPKALRYFPAGSKLSLGAGGTHGDYIEPSSIYLQVSLQLPTGELVGKEHIGLHNSTYETAFERFLAKLAGGNESERSNEL